MVVGRKLPSAVQARLARDYRPRLYPGDRLYTGAELLDLAGDADAARSSVEGPYSPRPPRRTRIRSSSNWPGPCSSRSNPSRAARSTFKTPSAPTLTGPTAVER